MRLSLNITNFSSSEDPSGIGAWLGRIARAADESGLDTLWVSDHLLQADPNSSLDAQMLEVYTTLGFLAAQTEGIRLGTMVTAVTYRPPALLVNAVTTLDVLSGERAWLGIGAGYHQGEATAMGLPLPALGERFERLEEMLRLALSMWPGVDSDRRHRIRRPIRTVARRDRGTRADPAAAAPGAGLGRTGHRSPCAVEHFRDAHHRALPAAADRALRRGAVPHRGRRPATQPSPSTADSPTVTGSSPQLAMSSGTRPRAPADLSSHTSIRGICNTLEPTHIGSAPL